MTKNEKRLEVLAKKVKLERSKGRVQKWPDDLKIETIFLVEEFGLKKVSDTTNFRVPFLCLWRKKQLEAGNQDHDLKNKKLQITQILTNQPKDFSKDPILLGSLTREAIEFKIYSKKLCEKIARRFLS